jgi:hypothetical protein
MTSDNFLSSQERLKFGIQRAVLVTTLAASICGGLGLLAWAARFPDYALQAAGNLLTIRGQADGDARVAMAHYHEKTLVSLARIIAKDDQCSVDERRARLKSLDSFFDQAQAEIKGTRQDISFADTRPVTVLQDPISKQFLAMNATPTGTVDPRVLERFQGQSESLSALVWLANERAMREAPVDGAAIVKRDLAEALAQKK